MRGRRRLREKKYNTAAVIERMLEAVAIVDLDGTIRQVNSEFERGSGWKREEVVGKTAIELGIMSKEEGREIEKEVMPKLMKEGFVRNVETIVTRRDGTKFPAVMNWTLMKDAKGKPTGIIAVARDITRRKRAEEVFQSLLDDIPDSISIYFKDEKKRFVRVSKSKEKHLGVDQDEIIGKTDFDFYPEEQAREMAEDDERVMRTGEPIVGKVEKITRPDGEERWISVVKAPRYDKNGNVIGIVGISRDITEQMEAEEKLRKAERDWRDSFNSLEDVMVVIDRDYNIENINYNGLKILGKSRDEVIGKKCYKVVHNTDAPGEFCPFRKSLKTKSVESVDRYEKALDRYFSIKSSPISDENGEIMKFVCLLRDITELKRAEEDQVKAAEAHARAKEAEKHAKELEEKVEQLEKYHKITIGRELKMVELKKRIKELEEKLKK